jgi:hypothetical protein
VGTADLIAAYLDELRAKRPAGDLDEILPEIEDHLRSVAEAHLGLGLSWQDAQHHVLATFGSAEDIRRAFASTRGKGAAMSTPITRSAGVIAMLGGVLLAATLCLAAIRPWDLGATTSWFGPLLATATILVIAGLIGVHLRHRAVYSVAGGTGRWLVPAGVVLLILGVATWNPPSYFVGLGLLVLGLTLVAVEVWRAGVIDRRALLLGAAGIPLALVVPVLGGDGWMLLASFAGFLALGAGLGWVGYGLWQEQTSNDNSTTPVAV